MKFELTATNRSWYERQNGKLPPSEVEINSLEELVEFISKEGGSVIITDWGPTAKIEIYNDYRE